MAAMMKARAANWRDLDATPRYPIYRIIHKALRGLMVDTLMRVGQMDVGDECEVETTMRQLNDLLFVCAGHLHHENEFVHPAIEQAEAGQSQRTAHEHVSHGIAIRSLEQQVLQFMSAAPDRRDTLAHELYLDLSNFVAENLEHMAIEETENHAVLIRHYSDEQLLAIEQSIRASLSPRESRVGMRWMLPHMNANERARMLNDMQRNAPPQVFSDVMALAGEVLSQRDFYKLQKALM